MGFTNYLLNGMILQVDGGLFLVDISWFQHLMDMLIHLARFLPSGKFSFHAHGWGGIFEDLEVPSIPDILTSNRFWTGRITIWWIKSPWEFVKSTCFNQVYVCIFSASKMWHIRDRMIHILTYVTWSENPHCNLLICWLGHGVILPQKNETNLSRLNSPRVAGTNPSLILQGGEATYAAGPLPIRRRWRWTFGSWVITFTRRWRSSYWYHFFFETCKSILRFFCQGMMFIFTSFCHGNAATKFTEILAQLQPQVIVCAACCGAKGFGAFIVPCPPRWSGDPGNLRQKIWEEDLVDMLILPKINACPF